MYFLPFLSLKFIGTEKTPSPSESDIQRDESDDKVMPFLSVWKKDRSGIQPGFAFDSSSQLTQIYPHLTSGTSSLLLSDADTHPFGITSAIFHPEIAPAFLMRTGSIPIR
jgi:uncharacterized protein YwbE